MDERKPTDAEIKVFAEALFGVGVGEAFLIAEAILLGRKEVRNDRPSTDSQPAPSSV